MLLDDQLLTQQQAAAYCGVSIRTLYNWIAEKRFPVIRLDRLVRIKRSDLETYLRVHTERAIDFPG
jgi:excisionase family DNA binding protein